MEEAQHTEVEAHARSLPAPSLAGPATGAARILGLQEQVERGLNFTLKSKTSTIAQAEAAKKILQEDWWRTKGR